MTTTTAREVHFTSIPAFLDELRADHAAGEIVGNLVRLAVTNGEATESHITGRPAQPGVIPGWRTRYVECSYVSARDQLVKVSAYAGADWIGGEQRRFRPTANSTVSQDTRQKVAELGRQLQAALYVLDGLTVRGGGLYLENGFWTADPDHTIEDLPALMCATCLRDIYFANAAWRHAEADQVENLVWKKGDPQCYVSRPCPECRGKRGERPCGGCFGSLVKLTVHHVADPEQEGRQV